MLPGGHSSLAEERELIEELAAVMRLLVSMTARPSGLVLDAREQAEAIMTMRDARPVRVIPSTGAVVELQPVGYRSARLAAPDAAARLDRTRQWCCRSSPTARRISPASAAPPLRSSQPGPLELVWQFPDDGVEQAYLGFRGAIFVCRYWSTICI